MAHEVSAIASPEPWAGDILTNFVARACRNPVWITATAIFVFATAFFLHFWLTARSDLANIKADGQHVSSFDQQVKLVKELGCDVSSTWDSVSSALNAYDSLDAARLGSPGYAARVHTAFRLGRVAIWRVDEAIRKVKWADLTDPTFGRIKALDSRELFNFKDDLRVRHALLLAELSRTPAAIFRAHWAFSQQLNSSARTEFEVSVAQAKLGADLAAEEAENRAALVGVGHRAMGLLMDFSIAIACVVFVAC